jgi:acyl dehydratase
MPTPEQPLTTEGAAVACVTTLGDLPLQVGRTVGPTAWRRMTQDRIDRFADVTGDHNFIHVDPVRARETPFRGTIAHGYLTLSLLGPITQELISVSNATTSVNYGLNKVRFPAPLPVDAEFRGRGQILEATPFPNGVQVTATFTVELKGAEKPALVAECLFRYYK